MCGGPDEGLNLLFPFLVGDRWIAEEEMKKGRILEHSGNRTRS
jgi:hypothetical protein